MILIVVIIDLSKQTTSPVQHYSFSQMEYHSPYSLLQITGKRCHVRRIHEEYKYCTPYEKSKSH